MKRTARQQIERAFHVSFKLPAQAAALLDAYRDEVLAEAANLADERGEELDAAGLHEGAEGARSAAAQIRAARTTTAPTSRHCATPNSALPCGRHCRHDLCADCGRCCTCQCATAPTTQES